MPHLLHPYKLVLGTSSGDPSPVINWDFLQSQSLTSFSRTSNATLFDSTGKLTYAANNLLLNTATLSTQTVTTGLQAGVSVILSFSGTGSAAISGGYTGSLAGTGVSDRVFLKFTTTTNSLTFTVTGSVTSAQLEAVTYQTTPSTYTATTSSQYYGPRYPYAYNGTTWDAQGLLVEAAATNLAQYSQDFTTSSWNYNSYRTALVSTAAAIAPDGTTTACKLYESTASQQVFRVLASINGSSGVKTFSVYAKKAERKRIILFIDASGTAGAWFDLDLGTSGATTDYPSILNKSMTPVGGGWYRCSITVTGTSGTTYAEICLTASDTQTIFEAAARTGDGASGVYIWGAQFELSGLPTSYIPNLSTGTTTRNADTSLAFSAISLPTGLSFSRASNAMQYDAAGRLTYAPHNLAPYSEQFDNGVWTDAPGTQTISITPNQASAPDGNTTADLCNCAAVSASQYAVKRQSISIAAGTYLCSMYVKAATVSDVGKTFTLYLNDGTTPYWKFHILTSNWTRISVLANYSAGTAYVSFGSVGSSYGGVDQSSISAHIWGAQLEAVTYETVARPYVANSTANAVYGPRYDYDPLTRLPKGLLVEEARTNLSVQSGSLTNAAWTAYQSDTGTDATTTPSGTTAVKLTAQAGTGYKPQLYNTTTIAFSASTNYSFSCYVKAGTHNFVAIGFQSSPCFVVAVFDLGNTSNTTRTQLLSNSGTSVSTTQTYVGNGWYRIASVASLSSGTGTAYTTLQLAQAATGNSQDGYGNLTWNPAGTESAYFAFPQFELGSFPTSYIPNPGIASGIRSADITNVTGANFSSFWNATEGTFYFAGASNTDTGSSAWCFSADDGTLTGNSLYAFCNGAPVTYRIFRSSGLEVDINAGNRSQGVKFKVATGYKANDAAASLNGSAAIADTSVTLPTVDRLNIGRNPSGQFYLNGHIAAFKYWRVRLSNAKLQTETA